jgi:hypothetical protein
MEEMTQCKRRIRGTTVVELAFTLPFLLMFMLGALHYGWLFYHLHRVTNANRHAARVGTLVGRSEQDVKDTITTVLGLDRPDIWPHYSLDVDDTTQVNIQDVTITVGMGTVPGIKVDIIMPTANNPHVLLIKIPYFRPLYPTYLAASVTMAKESG